MADKISELPAVVTPAKTHEIPVNQGGTTRKQTRAQMHTLGSGEQLTLPLENDPTTPELAFGDGDSGLYESADDVLSVALNNAEAIRFEDPNDLAAGETSLWLYDQDDGSMLQVEVGADDSGGTGYRLLRVPNVTP